MSQKLKSWIGTDLQQPNWDSCQSEPVTTRTINVAMQIADRLEGLVIDGRKLDCLGLGNDGCVEISDGDASVWIHITTIEPEPEEK
jgi:hypothetical protein